MHAIDFQLAEDGGVERGCYAWGARQMLGALAHAVVHVVTFRCNDPVVPLDIFELDVKVSLAAHGDIVATAQRALLEHVSGGMVTQAHLGHHEGLIGGVGGAVQEAQVLPIVVTGDLQTQLFLAAIQKGLQCAGDGEGVPVTLLHLQHLFYHQSAVGGWIPAVCGEKNLGDEAGVPVRVLRGVDINPQGRLKNLDVLVTFLQKLEGKAETGLIAACPLCE